MLGESVAKLSRTFNLNPFEDEQTAKEVSYPLIGKHDSMFDLVRDFLNLVGQM
jgi:hypothetical protein